MSLPQGPSYALSVPLPSEVLPSGPLEAFQCKVIDGKGTTLTRPISFIPSSAERFYKVGPGYPQLITHQFWGSLTSHSLRLQSPDLPLPCRAVCLS